MIECLDYEATMRMLARIFLEAMEMGAVAERFPRAIFTIGCSSATRSAPQQFDLFANVARLGVALTGINVASGIHDHASIRDLLRKDGWHYSKGAEDKPAIAITGWVANAVEYAFVIQDGTRTLPRNYLETPEGLALVAAGSDHGQRCVRRGRRRCGHQSTAVGCSA
jgi:hypothetical protein